MRTVHGPGPSAAVPRPGGLRRPAGRTSSTVDTMSEGAMDVDVSAADAGKAIDVAASAVRTLRRFGRRQALARDAGIDLAPMLELFDGIDRAGLAVVAELADLLGLPPSRVRLLASRATAAGLILTTDDEWDGRHVVYRLTESGREAVAALHAARADAIAGATFG